MRPVIQAVASGVTGAQSAIILSTYMESFTASLYVKLVSGAATFTVEYTLAPLNELSAIGGTVWTEANAPWVATSIAAASASAAGSLTLPVTAVRLNIASSTAGVLQFFVLQSGGTK